MCGQGWDSAWVGQRSQAGCLCGSRPLLPPPESVKDLIRYLRYEDETRDVRQQLGAAQILQNDLLPLIAQYPQDKLLFDAVVRSGPTVSAPSLRASPPGPASSPVASVLPGVGVL